MTDDLIEQIKANREAGTPGPWRIVLYDGGDVDHWAGAPMIDGPEDAAIVHWDGFQQRFWRAANGNVRAIEANARRIALIPDMEARILSDAARIRKHEEEQKT